MKKIPQKIYTLIFTGAVIYPGLVFGQMKELQTILKTCGKKQCQWTDFMTLITALAGFLIQLGIAFSVIVLLWAGALYLFSGGDSGKISQAHEMFKKVAIGLVVMLLAYSLVSLVTKTFNLKI